MSHLIMGYVGLVLSVMVCGSSVMWRIGQVGGLLLALLALSLTSLNFCVSSVSGMMVGDFMSVGLTVLSIWLLPLMLIASQRHMVSESMLYQRVFIVCQVFLTGALVLAFLASDLLIILYCIWIYFTAYANANHPLSGPKSAVSSWNMFYILYVGSVFALLVCLVGQYQLNGSLAFNTIYSGFGNSNYLVNFWWLGCILAFLVKLPLYGAHLWLPKAHVEAPIAGSMVLAGVLLKLGGYGMMRVSYMWGPAAMLSSEVVLGLALWGMASMGAICLRQTDLKSLIAYSSVGHMALVVGGIMTGTVWGYNGAMILMIAHGLVSSCLFSLANFWYERSGTRNLVGSRGVIMLFPLMGLGWLSMSLMNLALPPAINLFGELISMVAVYNWSMYSIVFMSLGAVLTAGYSLYMFGMSQWGDTMKTYKNLYVMTSREYLLVFLHLSPAVYLVFYLGLMF
uniref:NADH-ubiquinone oxidoreductase chain 4 n=1 Tax=Branchiostoma lanceolatum TaxID=7740 RepID=C6L336_BRALA|nr:NADH dehydrogenase subunit 4 [Branchiostoma lanceolatum]BAH86271.1 NADH dehydrogenase subunit 4 [Branchiostoma lanceolatum]